MRDSVSRWWAEVTGGAVTRLNAISWKRALAEAGLLLGFALASSWLAYR